MKVKELIEWLQMLNPEYEIMRDDLDQGHQEISAIDTYEVNREYVIH